MTTQPSPIYPLFQHMLDAHGLTLIDDELREIADAVRRCGAKDPPTLSPEAREALRWMVDHEATAHGIYFLAVSALAIAELRRLAEGGAK